MKLKVLKSFYNSTGTYHVGNTVELKDEEAAILLEDERGLVEKITEKPARKKGSESLTAES